MSNLGDLINNVDEVIPPSIINAKSIWRTAGDNIPLHNIDEDVGAVVCDEDGSSYLADHMYIQNSDKSAWVDVFKQHLHTSDGDGGSYFDMRSANANNILEFNFQNFRAGHFVNMVTTTGGTATITDQHDSNSVYLEYYSPINTAYCNSWAGGLKLSFGKPFLLQAKYKCFEATNILFRIGCGLSTIESSGSQAQVGFEACGSDPKITIVSATGTDRNTADLSNMLQTNPMGLRCEYYVDRIVAKDSQGGLANKTDNLPPPSTATGGNSTFRVGHKTTATTSGNARSMWMYSGYLLGYIYDSGVGQWL